MYVEPVTGEMASEVGKLCEMRSEESAKPERLEFPASRVHLNVHDGDFFLCQYRRLCRRPSIALINALASRTPLQIIHEAHTS